MSARRVFPYVHFQQRQRMAFLCVVESCQRHVVLFC